MGSAPSMNDSAASLNGQLFGTAGVGAAGIMGTVQGVLATGAGEVFAPVTGGASLSVSAVGVGEAALGTAVTAGATANANAIGNVMAAKQSGSYTNTHESGMTYDGKGSPERAAKSGARVEAQTGDKHVSTDHTPAPNDREGFKGESRRLDSHGGAGSDTNHNQIDSPGKKYRQKDGSH